MEVNKLQRICYRVFNGSICVCFVFFSFKVLFEVLNPIYSHFIKSICIII
jgi:hypothetical protein